MKRTGIKGLWIAAVFVAMLVVLSGCGGKSLEKAQQDTQKNAEKENMQEEIKENIQEETKANAQEDMQQDTREGKGEETAGIGKDFLAVVQNFSPLFLSFDEDGYLFDQALHGVKAYLEGEKTQEEVLDRLQEILALYQEHSAGLEEFVLEDGLADQLAACGISAEEYKAFGNSRGNDIYSHTVSLTTLLEYLESAEELQESHEDLAFFYSVHRDEQENMRGYYYYGCLNYWFAGASEEERAYLDEQVICKIKAYRPKEPVWYDNREEIENVVMGYLDAIEQIDGQVAKHVGKAQEELYGMEQDYQKLLDSIEEKQAMEEKLAQLKEINARIEAINKEAAEAKGAGDEEKLSVLKEEFDALVAEYEELVE